LLGSCTVRSFRGGDEELVVGLFNKVYAGYGGYVPRTVEYWRWCCLRRPDVDERGVFLAFDGERLCGYVVAGSSGNIWEYCVANGQEMAARMLLSEALKYLESLGVSSVNINVPRDAGVAAALAEAGFGEVAPERMFITTLSPASLVRALVSSWKGGLFGASDEAFAVRLRGVPVGVGSEFSVKVGGGGKVEVSEGCLAEASVVIDLGFLDFLSFLFDGSSAGRLLLAGRLRVRPFRKFRVALRFLSALRPTSSWFFPLSDFG
jgi:hypothetical protein